MRRSGAPLTAPKDCGTYKLSKFESGAYKRAIVVGMTLSPERSGGRQYARQLTGAVYCVLATRRRPPRCLADVTEEALAVEQG